MTYKYRTLLNEHRTQIDEFNVKLNKSMIEQAKHLQNYTSLFEDFENYKTRAQNSLKKQKDHQVEQLSNFRIDEYLKLTEELEVYKDNTNKLNERIHNET